MSQALHDVVLDEEVSLDEEDDKPLPEKLPEAPREDASVFIAKKALVKLSVRSIDFPKYAAVRFSNQDHIDILYWLEFIFETRLCDIPIETDLSENRYAQDVKKLNKTQILDKLSQSKQIILFKKNKRHHAKVNQVIGSDALKTCVILMDNNHDDENDFRSLSIIMQPVFNFKPKMFFTHKERNDFILNNKIQSRLTEKFEIRYNHGDVPDQAANRSHAQAKRNKISANKKLAPLQAGMFDRFAHNVRRVKRHFKAPNKRSVSRTTTFSRRNDHPEEVDEYHQEENEARIDALEKIRVSQDDPKSGALQRFIKNMKRIKAEKLLAKLQPNSENVSK